MSEGAPTDTGPATPQAAEESKPVVVGLTERQRLILSHLTPDPTHVDGLVERTSLTVSDVLQELTLLSLKGIVRRVDGQSFVRTKAATL